MAFAIKKLSQLIFILVLFVLESFFSAAYADLSINQSNLISHHNNWFVGIGGGANWTSLENNNTTVLNGADVPAPMNQDIFTINDPTGSMFQLFVGYRWYREQQLFPFIHLLLQYQHFNNSHIEGNVTQYSLPEFQNYNYKMSYDANLFALIGKIDLIKINRILPYLSGGIGFILNHVNDYEESPTAFVTPRTSPAYNGNTIANAVATLGAGFDFILTENYWLTFGYEHIFQSGNIHSGNGAGSWSGTQLNFGNANIDTVFINLSINFPQGFRS